MLDVTQLKRPTTDEERYQAWHYCRDNPLRFVTEVLGVEPEPHQREALVALAENTHVAIRSGHDQGKTALLAWAALWFLTSRYPCKVPIAANTQDQLRDITWPEIMKWARRMPQGLRERYDIGLERISLRGAGEECFAVGRTASKSNPEALQGFHSENLMFLLEEASGMEDIIFEIAAGAMSSKGARALMIGNPNRSQGYFCRAFKENRWLWHGLHWPWRLNPWSDAKYPVQMAREYGETSNVYKVRVLGDFPVSEDNAVIPLDIIEAAIRREVDRVERRAVVWGFDIARFGDDRCAVVKRQGNHVIGKVLVWRWRDLMESAGIVAREYFETPDDDRPAAINADVIGVGAGVVDRLRELGLPIFGINVGEVSMDPDRFVRQRDELWWKARDWFYARDCSIPNNADLVSDLVAPTYHILSSGKLQVETKEDMKKRGVKSPDLADAFCLTFAGGEFAPDYRRHSHGITDEWRDPLDTNRSERNVYDEQQAYGL